MKFLIIDDNPADREIIVRLLQKEFYSSEFITVLQQKDFDEVITHFGFDVVITEYSLSWADGLWILRKVRERLPYIPVVMVTSTGREEIIIEGMKSGLSSFVLKKQIHLLPATVKEGIERAKLLKTHDEINQKYRSLMNDASEVISVIDTEGNLLEISKKAESLTGYTKKELIHMNLVQLFPKKETDRVITAFNEGVQKGSWSISNVHFLKKDGRKVPVDITGNIIEYSGKREVLVIVRDITERKRFERCCGVHATMSILAESTTLNEAIPKILQTLGESLDWTLGEFWIMDSKAGVLRFFEIWHKPSVRVTEFESLSREIVFSSGAGLPGNVYASRKPIWITDVVSDPNFHRAHIAAKEGLHGALGFPIMAENEVLGVFVFLSHEVQQADEDLLMIMASIGCQIGQFIRRKQAEEALHQAYAELELRIRERTTALARANETLRMEIIQHKTADKALQESEERFKKLAEKVRLIPWEADARTWKFTYIGPQALEILGYPMETWYAANFWTEHIHPEDRKWVVNYCAEQSKHHENYEFEYRMLSADERIVWLRDIVNVVRDEKGPKILRGFMIDITEHKQTEEELKELNESLEIRVEERTRELMKANEELQVKIAEHKQIENALNASEARYHDLFENSPVSLWEEDSSEVKAFIDSLRKSGITNFRTYFDNHPEAVHKCAAMVRIIDVNKATLTMYKAKSKEHLLCGLPRSFDKGLFDVYKEALIALAEGRTLFEAETITRTFNGSKNYVFLRMSVSPGFEQTWARIFVSLIDITERKRIEEALRRRIDFEKTVVNISTRFVTLSDFNNAIAASLADIGRLSGASRAYLFQFRDNGNVVDNTHEWCDEGVTPEIQNLQNLPTAMFPWWMATLRTDNVIHITDVSKMPPEATAEKDVLEKQGIKSLLGLPVYAEKELVGFMGFDNVRSTGTWCEEDIDLLRITAEIIGNAIARKRSEALITHMAYHDTLTNLPNRNLFKDRLQLAVAHAKRHNQMAAVMILDLDNFKTINDSLGHHVGDLLLKAVAGRLKQCIREGDTIARTGGDEFTVVLSDLTHVQDAATVAQKILHALYQPFQLDGHEINITTSIGISLYPIDAEDTEYLVKKADIAMYLSKEHGKNTYRFFKTSMNTNI